MVLPQLKTSKIYREDIFLPVRKVVQGFDLPHSRRSCDNGNFSDVNKTVKVFKEHDGDLASYYFDPKIFEQSPGLVLVSVIVCNLKILCCNSNLRISILTLKCYYYCVDSWFHIEVFSIFFYVNYLLWHRDIISWLLSILEVFPRRSRRSAQSVQVSRIRQ